MPEDDPRIKSSRKLLWGAYVIEDWSGKDVRLPPLMGQTTPGQAYRRPYLTEGWRAVLLNIREPYQNTMWL
jgi:hypothetical protein